MRYKNYITKFAKINFFFLQHLPAIVAAAGGLVFASEKKLPAKRWLAILGCESLVHRYPEKFLIGFRVNKKLSVKRRAKMRRESESFTN